MSSTRPPPQPPPPPPQGDPQQAPGATAKGTRAGEEGGGGPAGRATAGKEAQEAPREHDFDADGVLLGIEDLPMVGAAGVLLMPLRARNKAQAQGRPGAAGASLALKGFEAVDAAEDFMGWGEGIQAQAPLRLYDEELQGLQLAEYVAAETGLAGGGGSDGDGNEDTTEPVEPLTWEQLQQVQALVGGARAPTPKDGPSIVMLAKDPKRREECPVCAAEWSTALRQIGVVAPMPSAAQAAAAAEAASQAASRRSTLATTGRGRVKMHSVLCTWRWFQQNLCASLCAMRFDEHGNPRVRCTSPLAFLPPAMYDVWHHWKQKGSRDRNHDRALAAERLVRGEPTG